MAAEPQDLAGPLFSRIITVGDGKEPREGKLETTQAERDQLAKQLRIEGLDSFSFSYRLTPIPHDRFQLTGSLQASLTQLCVVTLEPVAERIDEAVEVECWPQHQIGTEDDEPVDPAFEGLPPDPPAPIIGGKLDVGALGAEILASAINPYPRKPDAEFAWDDPKAAGPSGPFAGLAKLKDKG
ncbi:MULTISPECIES: hypothetical protein [Rhodomicrobium]|uniref:YceD family protein n=1 Tax=Rhodomicrobium TaxID=1068 RepID=UPI0014836868|nr:MULTISPECIES: hypothetical protein [Rhodomicrobium]